MEAKPQFWRSCQDFISYCAFPSAQRSGTGEHGSSSLSMAWGLELDDLQGPYWSKPSCDSTIYIAVWMLATDTAYMSCMWSWAAIQNTPANDPKSSIESRWRIKAVTLSSHGVLQASKHALYAPLFFATDWCLRRWCQDFKSFHYSESARKIHLQKMQLWSIQEV